MENKIKETQVDIKSSHLNKSNDSSIASDFENDLEKLIDNYVKAGLKKHDLVKKMKWMTGYCEFS